MILLCYTQSQVFFFYLKPRIKASLFKAVVEIHRCFICGYDARQSTEKFDSKTFFSSAAKETLF